MPDTIREQIISDFLSRLSFWLPENNFNFACGRKVFRAVKNIDEESLPACIFYPEIETIEHEYGLTICTMTLRIEALAASGRENKSVIQEKLLGDVIKIMTDPGVVISTKPEEILYTEGGPAGLQKPEENVTAVYADFSVKYSTKTGDPYHQ